MPAPDKSARAQTARPSKAEMRRACAVNPPSRFLDYKDFLAQLFAELKQRMGHYTYQTFSEDLGYPRGNGAYVLIHGLRKMSRIKADTLIDTLALVGPERKYLLRLVDYTDCDDDAEKERLFQALADAKALTLDAAEDGLALAFFRSWHNAAIFEMVGLPHFRSDPAWIAAHLYQPIAEDDAREALLLLEKLGLVHFDSQAGRHVKSRQSVSTGDAVRGMAIVGYHLQMMELGRAALSRVPSDEREIGAVTLPVTDELAERLKRDLLTLRRYAIFEAEQCQDPTKLLQLNFQLFPLTRE